MKLPQKIKAVKLVFENDNNYVITDGRDLSITGDTIKSMTIWWEEKNEKKIR
jgi:hypothetical protein